MNVHYYLDMHLFYSKGEQPPTLKALLVCLHWDFFELFKENEDYFIWETQQSKL